jgi:hypothetical protein
LLLVAGCQDSGEALATERVRGFIFALAGGQYEAAVDLVRAENGSPLAAAERAERIAEWRRAYGDGTKIKIERFSVTNVRPSTREELPVVAERGYQVVFALDGASATPCFRLPNVRATERVALIDDRWYLIPDALNTLRPPQNCNAP